ncbi:MAG: response regulator [Solirubrobacterales bacterium]
MSAAPVEILIAEDNPDHAELALHAFRRHRLTNPVHIVNDGQTALDFLLRQGEYKNRERAAGGELVLLDLKLPDINGLEVLGRIKANAETKATPVVMLTASTEGEHIRESFRLGAEAYIVKPVTFTAFLEAIRDSGHALTMVGKES